MDFNRIHLNNYLPSMPYKVRELLDKVTNIVMNYTETEVKVIEATNDESWGLTGKLLQDLSQLSHSCEYYNELMGMLWKRCFSQDKKYWRRTYKSLIVLTYLIKNGNERVVQSIREHLFDLKSLENFSYYDDRGKDQGINIRNKVKELIEFIQNDDRIQDERKKAKANRNRYVGMSSESLSYYHHDNDESNTKKTKNFNDIDGNWKSPMSSNIEEDYSKEINYRNTKSIWKDDPNKIQCFVNDKKATPVADLLGDVDFTSCVQDSEFGDFQEAVSSTSLTVQSKHELTSIQSSSSILFDSFETTTNLLQPVNQIWSNEFDFLMTPNTLRSNQEQQSLTNSPIFQQQSTVQSSNTNSLNTASPQLQQSTIVEKQNTWSSAEGKLDISLNNLIPHTRGDLQKTSLPLNQLTHSNKHSMNLDFTALNTNIPSILSVTSKK